MTELTLLLTGTLTGLGLIVAIGAQNAYLLRQGLRHQQVGPLIVFCVLADATLIGLAVLGIGALVATWPTFLTIARWGGGIFVIGYGLQAAWRAMHPGETLEADDAARGTSLGRSLLTMAALTFLNPHVYLDVTLLGTIANTHGLQDRWWFYAGTVLGSTVWFTLLGLGSRALAPFFARPRSWQVLDALIAIVMVSIGLGLILGS